MHGFTCTGSLKTQVLREPGCSLSIWHKKLLNLENKYHRIIKSESESQNGLGWKGPQSPPTPTPIPGQPVPLPHCSYSEEIVPDIQPKPLLKAPREETRILCQNTWLGGLSTAQRGGRSFSWMGNSP